MSKKSKKNKEKRESLIWKFFEDGIWDIYLGILVIWLGLIIYFHWSNWFGLMIIPFAIIPIMLKRWVTLPRAVDLKLKAKKKRKITGIAIIVVVIFSVLLFSLKKEPGLTGLFHYIQENSNLVIGSLLGTVTWFLAYALGFQRLYFYGLLLFVAFFFDSGLSTEKPFGFTVVAGVIILLAGSYLFFKFFKEGATK
ncbi:MAG: hypothetical protein ACYDH1_07020 [Anaerolineaceae bacterium]